MIVHKFAAVVDIQRPKRKGQSEANAFERLNEQSRFRAPPAGAASVQPLAMSVRTKLLT